MTNPPHPHQPADDPCDIEDRRRVFQDFYALEARELMDPDVDRFTYLPLHLPMLEAIELFTRVDHAWVTADTGTAAPKLESILLRADLLRAVQPAHPSYTRFRRARFLSLAHGAADCTCCFTAGRVLHRVPPHATCKEVVHLLEAKGASYIPVVEGDRFLGEIGPRQVMTALHRLHQRDTGPHT